MAGHFSIKETDGNFKQMDLFYISTNDIAPEDIKYDITKLIRAALKYYRPFLKHVLLKIRAI